MKILFGNKYFYMKGGSERVFFDEREYLKANGHEVVDFSTIASDNFQSDCSDYFIPLVDFKSLNSVTSKIGNAVSFIRSKTALKALKRLIQKEQPDLAHLHNIYHQLTPSIIPALKKNGIKVILTLHDYKLICPNYTMLNQDEICEKCQGKHFYHATTSGCSASLLGGLIFSAEAYWHYWKKSYEQVDYIIAPSAFMKEMISRQRVPEEKIILLKNGIDVHDFRPLYDDDRYMLYFGRISKEKGVKTLLNAFVQANSKLPLKIVGTGPLESELKTDYPEVEFCGYQSGEDLKSLIKNAAFVIVPSEWYENCCMVVIEAMALGKAVIGSRIGGIPEQVEDNITGLLYETGNTNDLKEKIIQLSEDSDLRKKMGMAARKKVEREYALQGHCEQLLEIYNKTLKR